MPRRAFLGGTTLFTVRLCIGFLRSGWLLGGGRLLLLTPSQVLFIAGFEVCLIPATALEAKGHGRHLFLECRFTAGGAIQFGGITDLL